VHRNEDLASLCLYFFYIKPDLTDKPLITVQKRLCRIKVDDLPEATLNDIVNFNLGGCMLPSESVTSSCSNRAFEMGCCGHMLLYFSYVWAHFST
jgi:hypothetical protein